MARSDRDDNGLKEPLYDPRRNGLPPELFAIIKSSVQFGGIAGVSGVLVGSFAGIIRSSTPRLFALASGIQWFSLGTTYWASREAVIYARGGQEAVQPRERLFASAIAGGIGGTVGGVIRGPRNIIPGAIMFTLFGATGQALVNILDHRVTKKADHLPDRSQASWMNSKWSPVKVLSDVEYENMLREKLLRVNAQISLVDDSISSLRQLEQTARVTSKTDMKPSSN